jgi:hypothetical protein
MVTGGTPATTAAAKLPGQTTNSLYGPRDYANEGSEDAHAHQGDYELLDEVDC